MLSFYKKRIPICLYIYISFKRRLLVYCKPHDIQAKSLFNFTGRVEFLCVVINDCFKYQVGIVRSVFPGIEVCEDGTNPSDSITHKTEEMVLWDEDFNIHWKNQLVIVIIRGFFCRKFVL